MTGRGDLSVLSLQIFVIDYGTMTGIGYLSVLSLQIFVVGEHCPYLQWRHLTVNHGTMTGRGYLWVQSINQSFYSQKISIVQTLLNGINIGMCFWDTLYMRL